MAGLDGESAGIRGSAGTQRHCHRGTRGADAHFRAHLLFRHLPIGRDAGSLRMDGKESKEEPLHVLQSQERTVGDLLRPDSDFLADRLWQPRATAGSLFSLWAHHRKPAPAHLYRREQRAGYHC